MITFDDLVFVDRSADFPTTSKEKTLQGAIVLNENARISVITGPRHYSTVGETYEVAVFHNGWMVNLKPYDQVLGHQSPEEVTKLMEEIQDKGDEFFAEKEKERIEYEEELY